MTIYDIQHDETRKDGKFVYHITSNGHRYFVGKSGAIYDMDNPIDESVMTNARIRDIAVNILVETVAEFTENYHAYCAADRDHLSKDQNEKIVLNRLIIKDLRSQYMNSFFDDGSANRLADLLEQHPDKVVARYEKYSYKKSKNI